MCKPRFWFLLNRSFRFCSIAQCANNYTKEKKIYSRHFSHSLLTQWNTSGVYMVSVTESYSYSPFMQPFFFKQKKKCIGHILIQLEVLSIGMTTMLLILSLFVGWILICLQRLKTYLNFSFYCLGFRTNCLLKSALHMYSFITTCKMINYFLSLSLSYIALSHATVSNQYILLTF